MAFDFGDLDDGGVPTFSVVELAEAINSALRRRFTDGVWVRGEIQGWSERGPHAYFRLVEEGEDGKAAINVQFFANSRMRLRPILAKHRLRLGDGLKACREVRCLANNIALLPFAGPDKISDDHHPGGNPNPHL